MLEIGITGGIGSGKSTVANILASFGYAIYDSDARAKALYTSSKAVKQQVTAAFGQEIYLPSGELNRPAMAQIVFNDKARLQELNNIVHPATALDFQSWLNELEEKGYPKSLVFKEAAILFESGAYKMVDAVITVYAPKRLRLQRVLQRDGTNRAQVLARMSKQMPEIEKLQRADFVIYSDGQQMLIPQVQAALKYLNPA